VDVKGRKINNIGWEGGIPINEGREENIEVRGEY
jgi:hypothetical protein